VRLLLQARQRACKSRLSDGPRAHGGGGAPFSKKNPPVRLSFGRARLPFFCSDFSSKSRDSQNLFCSSASIQILQQGSTRANKFEWPGDAGIALAGNMGARYRFTRSKKQRQRRCAKQCSPACQVRSASHSRRRKRKRQRYRSQMFLPHSPGHHVMRTHSRRLALFDLPLAPARHKLRLIGRIGCTDFTYSRQMQSENRISGTSNTRKTGSCNTSKKWRGSARHMETSESGGRPRAPRRCCANANAVCTNWRARLVLSRRAARVARLSLMRLLHRRRSCLTRLMHCHWPPRSTAGPF
jgi:hypothetical protein